MKRHRGILTSSLAAPLAIAVGMSGCHSGSSNERGVSEGNITIDDASPGLGAAVITCTSLTATQGTLGGGGTSACTPAGGGALATVDSDIVSWEPHSPPTSADAQYASPFKAADVTKLEVLVQYTGDDGTEPLWYWYAKNVVTGTYDVIGNSSTAGNWVSTAFTFNVANPSNYVDASGNVTIRFDSKTSTNSAELDQMVVRVTGKTSAATDSGTVDSGTADATTNDTTSADTSAPPDTGAVDTGSTDTGGTTTDIHDPNLFPKFEITLDSDAIAVFSDSSTATQKTWVQGTFKYGDQVLTNVGFRRKGTSTYRWLPQKIALKVSFDKYVPGRRFMGLTDLTLNNEVSDPTYLSERLGYLVYRNAGMPAQKANSAIVYINGEYFGVYTNVETPDLDFITRVFGSKARTLDECNFGSDWLPGSEDGFDVKEGDKTKADLSALFSAVDAAQPATLLADVSPNLDTIEFLDHCAGEAAIGFYDGYAYAKWGPGNYFLAGDTSGVFSVIPWSLDLAFSDREGVVNAANPVDESGVATLIGRCKTSSTCWPAYTARVQKMLVNFESLNLVDVAKNWHAQIDAMAQADPKREATLDAYLSDTNTLYTWIANRPAVVRSQLGLPKP